MSGFVRFTLSILFLLASSCASEGTESGNPILVWGCACETDEDCDGVFDWQIEAYDAAIRTVECSPDTRGCRAVLEVEDSCYVNLAVESRAYDCSLSDEEIFERSASDPERPQDAQPAQCEQP